MIPLTATLDLVAPSLPAALVPPESYARVRAVATQLPAALAHWVFLECHLSAAPARTDLTVGVDFTEADVLGMLDRWRRLAAFGRRWSDVETVWHRHIDRVWLEFDLEPDGDVGPSLFFELRSRESWLSVVDAVTRLLPSTRRLLGQCVAQLPPSGRVLYIGIFPPRKSATVRLCIGGIPDDEIPDYLARVEWPGDTEALAADLVACRAAHGEGVGVLDLDIAARLEPRLGLEYMFRRDAQARCRLDDPGLLDALVERGWCSDAQRHALSTWPAATRVIMPHELWESVLHRRLNHVKLTFAVDRVREAKAYLSVGHEQRRRDSTQ
jgi:hypothetical protein